MQVVIPMSGLGSRFVQAGYSDIKPLIRVMNKPIIEWVCGMFNNNDKFIFICRDEHLENTPLKNELQRICPFGKIVSISGHKKGPVHAVNIAEEFILDDMPTIVNYCDFFMDWNYADFINYTLGDIQGAIPCYTGFHPHLLHKENLYAVCKINDQGYLTEIREKYRFVDDPTKNFHSAGTYYFKNGKLMKKLFREMEFREDLELNGELYVSMVYHIMLEKNMKIGVYKEISHFCQWGTPGDLNEFNQWAKLFNKINNGSVFAKNI
jgi:NDP-sugar pyrophosphorylase family protein